MGMYVLINTICIVVRPVCQKKIGNYAWNNCIFSRDGVDIVMTDKLQYTTFKYRIDETKLRDLIFKFKQ